MAAFASDRRSGWVRFLVVLLCALFIFSTLGAPAARAEALTVGLFTAAAVLSAATAALGFKLANSAEGQATLAKMVQDFKVSATAVGLVLVGSKINGLIDGVNYIKMQVKAGKTYLDERVVAWVQQWLAQNGVYDDVGYTISAVNHLSDVPAAGSSESPLDAKQYYTSWKSFLTAAGYSDAYIAKIPSGPSAGSVGFCYYGSFLSVILCESFYVTLNGSRRVLWVNAGSTEYYYNGRYWEKFIVGSGSTKPFVVYTESGDNVRELLVYPGTAVATGNTGLSGSDTIGKDVVDKTLDDTLAGLKEWAPDWWDAGADSSTNSAVGAKDLPLNMGSDVKTVTGNPALEVDQPLIYTPWFEETLDNLRSGETAGAVTNTATSAADTADKAEAAEGTVEDAQGVVQSIINWGLDYISPDKGLFSRFPLCIPYDAYLLVTAALGVDAQDLGEIVGQSPGELSAQIDDGVAVQSDFLPVVTVKHDWTQDGVTTPVEVTLDLRPYDGVIKMIRTLVSVYVIAELIASEYKRIRGS